MTLLLIIALIFGDIAALKSEPDLGKRSELALADADQQIDEARKAYAAGDQKAAAAALAEVAMAVEACYDALRHFPHSTAQEQILQAGRIEGARNDAAARQFSG